MVFWNSIGAIAPALLIGSLYPPRLQAQPHAPAVSYEVASIRPSKSMQANFYAVGPRAYWREMTRWDERRKVRYPPSGLQPLQTAVERGGLGSPRTRGRRRQPRRKAA